MATWISTRTAWVRSRSIGGGGIPELDPILAVLTPAQVALLSMFEDAWIERCDAPTLLGIATYFKFKSANSALSHIKPLIKKGFLELQPTTYRSVFFSSRRYCLTQAAVDRLDRKKRIAEANRAALSRPQV